VGYQQSDIEKVDLLLNGELIPDLSFLVHKDFAYERGKKVCAKLKSTLNKQTFSVPIQACIGNNIIARETMPALKKNVTGNMYGGDRTRKMKLWAKQKKGKAKMKELGKVRFESSNLKEILKGSY
jgi:GTP-binding protein LepA